MTNKTAYSIAILSNLIYTLIANGLEKNILYFLATMVGGMVIPFVLTKLIVWDKNKFPRAFAIVSIILYVLSIIGNQYYKNI